MIKQSERVRSIIQDRYIQPAVSAGKKTLSIRAGDVLKDAEATESFPRGRTPMICNVLQSQKLLRESGLAIERIDGPPSRQSRNVVVHYRIAEGSLVPRAAVDDTNVSEPETPEARAERVVNGLRGLLKNEIAAFGGAEAFMKWVRSDEEEAA